jgi:hypothetical protein
MDLRNTNRISSNLTLVICGMIHITPPEMFFGNIYPYTYKLY